MTENTPSAYAQFAAWARGTAPIPPELANACKAFPAVPVATLEEWFRRLGQENRGSHPIRSRTLYFMICDDEETEVSVEHVYLPEGEAGTCDHCGQPAHDPGLVGLNVGEDLALLTAEQALVLANRLVKAAELILESDEDLPDVEREAARFGGTSGQEERS